MDPEPSSPTDHAPSPPVTVTDSALARLVFGTDDPEAIGAAVDRVVRLATGAGVAAVRFTSASVGVTVGVTLDDGRDVVVKAFQPRWTEPFVVAARAAHSLLHDAGLPVPRPIGPPVNDPGTGIGTGTGMGTWCVVDGWLPDPGSAAPAGGFDDAVARAASARTLARVVGVLTSDLADEHRVALARHPLRAPAGQLWTEPHNPVFDFGLKPVGARWIDDQARTAKVIEDESVPTLPSIVGHADWAARNVRIVDGELVALYDLDSIACEPEPNIVGLAACTWAATGESGPVSLADPDQVRAFAADYEIAIGRSFTPDERRRLGAVALRHVAYVARLEHALAAAGLGDGRPPEAQRLLRAHGPAYLHL